MAALAQFHVPRTAQQTENARRFYAAAHARTLRQQTMDETANLLAAQNMLNQAERQAEMETFFRAAPPPRPERVRVTRWDRPSKWEALMGPPPAPARQRIDPQLILEIINSRGGGPTSRGSAAGTARFQAAVDQLYKRRRHQIGLINDENLRVAGLQNILDRAALARANARKSRRQGLIGKRNVQRQIAIDALNRAGYYDNRNNFSGQGTYRRANGTLTAGRGLYKRSKRRKQRLTYSGRKPIRSKKRTLKQLLSSIARRKLRRC
jgi:hypothetical protein